MVKKLEFSLAVFLLFLLVHSFYVYPPITSSIVGVVVSLVMGVAYKGSFLTTAYKLSVHKSMMGLYSFILLMLFVSLVVVVLHGTLDLSYSKNFISQAVQIVLVLLVFSFVYHDYTERCYVPTELAEKLIVWVFVVQTVVQVLAFLSPQVAAAVHLFYTDRAFERLYQGYGGIRGLGLTGSPGWGLAVGYGLAFLFYVKAYLISSKITVCSIVIGLLLVLGTFFAGRSGFVGALIALIFYLTASGNLLLKMRNAIYGAVLFFGITLLSYFSFPEFIALLQERVFPFVFEFFYAYEETGKLQTRSTNILMEMWDVEISDTALLVGTGWFTDPSTGAYYMNTDVGFVRNALFGGLFWVFLLFLYQAKLSGLNYLGCRAVPKNTKKFIFFIFVYLAILEAKAMTVGFNKYVLSISVFYSLALLYERYFWKRSSL